MTRALRAVTLSQAMATLFLCGLIWFVQVVHYPLFELVGESSSVRYQHEHEDRTTWVVAPAMLVEFAAAVLLVLRRPSGVRPWLPWVGLGLVAVIWVSTAFLQVPQHRILGSGFNADAHSTLVATNWIRTIAWTLRAPVALAFLKS